ncbi:hypothetical protein OIV83_001821 [Microbotryomycetes sp. JL201]|nr:hypothetical protein OIV83_001821 [Microbotryomycetes sp. JL201]
MSRYNDGIKSTFDHPKHVFESSRFLEALEAAGYLQRLDTSEERITARYQHALTKMQFASHSEAFVNQAGIRRVHGSTVQFFNEDPVSDPFVHICCSHLPPNKQIIVTPVGQPSSGWTPIGSPDEADGTAHYTVSYPGFWPITVVFDTNPQHLSREDEFRGLDDISDDDQDAYIRSARSASKPNGRSSSRNRASYNDYSDSSSSDSADEGTAGRYGRTSNAYSGGDFTGGEGGRSSSRRRASSRSRINDYSKSDNDASGYATGAGRYSAYESDAYGAGNSRARASSRARSASGAGLGRYGASDNEAGGYTSAYGRSGASDSFATGRARSRSRARSSRDF